MDRLNIIEQKLDAILDILRGETNGGIDRPNPVLDHSQELLALGTFTPKQHCALQMLLVGASNKDIAERFAITEDTAKVHVRSIAKKLGVSTRAQIVMKMQSPFNNIEDNAYQLMTGGLPKTWHREYQHPDPFAPLYETKRGNK